MSVRSWSVLLGVSVLSDKAKRCRSGKSLGLFRGFGGNTRLQMQMAALNNCGNDRPKNATDKQRRSVIDKMYVIVF